MVREEIVVNAANDAAFLKTLEEHLQISNKRLDQCFLVLQANQINYIAYRLHDALEAKRDQDTNIIQSWTIQPTLRIKVKSNNHIQVLKLSTMLREIQCLRVQQQQQQPDPLPIAFEIFPSLRSVEVLRADLPLIQHCHYFSQQLVHLNIEYVKMDTPGQVLASQSLSDSINTSSSSQSIVVWRRLNKLRMNCCNLIHVDSSVNHLPKLVELDLAWNGITHFELPLRCNELERLNLCHNTLTMVPPIHFLVNLRSLDLSVNRISSIEGIQVLHKLEDLNLAYNFLENIKEIELLVQLRHLQFIQLQFNPLTKRPDYRREVMFFLGQQVELDRRPWDYVELNSMNNSRSLWPRIARNLAAYTVQSSHDEVTEYNELEWGEDETEKTSIHQNIAGPLAMTYPQLLPSTTTKLAAQLASIRNPSSNLAMPKQLLQSSSNTSKHSSAEHTKSISLGDDDVLHSRKVSSPVGRTINDHFQTMGPKLHTNTRNSEEQYDFFNGKGTTDLFGNNRVDDANVSEIDYQSILSTYKNGDIGTHVTLDIKPNTVTENQDTLSDSQTKKQRKFSDIVAFGMSSGNDRTSSLHTSNSTTIASRRINLVMCRDQPLQATMPVISYVMENMRTLELLLCCLVPRLYNPLESNISADIQLTPSLYLCTQCGSLSFYTEKFSLCRETLSLDFQSPHLRSCLICSCHNIREVSMDKMISYLSTEQLFTTVDTIKSTITGSSTNKKIVGDSVARFYIEEQLIDENSILSSWDHINNMMEECVFEASGGNIREVWSQTPTNSSVYGQPEDDWY